MATILNVVLIILFAVHFYLQYFSGKSIKAKTNLRTLFSFLITAVAVLNHYWWLSAIYGLGTILYLHLVLKNHAEKPKTPPPPRQKKQSWIAKLLGIPDGQNLIWWMIGKQRGPWKQLAAFVGFISVFWFAYRSPWAAAAMMLGQQMIFINGLIGLFNLLPLINMDGGQLFHVIFSSLKERYDLVVAVLATAISAVIIIGIFASPIGQGAIFVLRALFYNFGGIFFLLLMAAGIWHKQGKDNPLHSGSKQAMTVKQVAIQLAFYTFMVTSILLLL